MAMAETMHLAAQEEKILSSIIAALAGAPMNALRYMQVTVLHCNGTSLQNHSTTPITSRPATRIMSIMATVVSGEANIYLHIITSLHIASAGTPASMVQDWEPKKSLLTFETMRSTTGAAITFMAVRAVTIILSATTIN